MSEQPWIEYASADQIRRNVLAQVGIDLDDLIDQAANGFESDLARRAWLIIDALD